MTREILLLDVTEMSGAHVCVAGIDPASCEQIRLADPTPTRALLRRLGGLAPGDLIVVDCQPLRRPTPPHTEDARWDPASLVKVRTLEFDEVCAIVSQCSFGSIKDAFGPAAGTGASGNHFWPPGRGSRSLATVRATYVRTMVDGGGTPRVALRDEGGRYYRSVPFQDLAVKTHSETCGSCDVAARLREEFDGNGVFVRVGLTRPYSPDARPPACWLQVTNVFARPRAHFR